MQQLASFNVFKKMKDKKVKNCTNSWAWKALDFIICVICAENFSLPFGASLSAGGKKYQWFSNCNNIMSNFTLYRRRFYIFRNFTNIQLYPQKMTKCDKYLQSLCIDFHETYDNAFVSLQRRLSSRPRRSPLRGPLAHRVVGAQLAGIIQPTTIEIQLKFMAHH